MRIPPSRSPRIQRLRRRVAEKFSGLHQIPVSKVKTWLGREGELHTATVLTTSRWNGPDVRAMARGLTPLRAWEILLDQLDGQIEARIEDARELLLR